MPDLTQARHFLNRYLPQAAVVEKAVAKPVAKKMAEPTTVTMHAALPPATTKPAKSKTGNSKSITETMDKLLDDNTRLLGEAEKLTQQVNKAFKSKNEALKQSVLKQIPAFEARLKKLEENHRKFEAVANKAETVLSENQKQYYIKRCSDIEQRANKLAAFDNTPAGKWLDSLY